ncbi:MAG: hypothetical protein II182_05905, partial [Lachnospiraceae bacterium]|nr:hypothetical protein [Lachnospiraceae bacterium]
MANMEDYLDWRGDLSFLADPFNEIDNLILSERVYTDFDGVVPKEGLRNTVSVQEVYEKFFALHSEEELMAKASSTKVAPFLLKRLV